MTIEIADRLCAYRKMRGLSQEELAEKIGVSRQAVSKWERAEASPDTDNLILLSKVYGVTLDELLNIDPGEALPMPPEPFEEQEDSHGLKAEISITLDDENAPPFQKRWNRVPWPVICAIVYLLVGFFDVIGGWRAGWLVFLTIPLYYSLGEAIALRDAAKFSYPVLVTMVYMTLGLYMGLWHPTWVLFITIPLYYPLCKALRKP